MQVKVKLNNLRVAPRKVKLVVDLIRGKNTVQAQSILSFTVNKSARSVLKLLNSAIASATHDFGLSESNLYVSEIYISEGPKLKRWHPMSRGRAYTILKRTSHIALTLSELKPSSKKEITKKEKPTEKREKTSSSKNQTEKVKTKKKTVRRAAAKK